MRAKTVSGDIVLTAGLRPNQSPTPPDETEGAHHEHADRDRGPAPDPRAGRPRAAAARCPQTRRGTASPSGSARSPTGSTTDHRVRSGTHRDAPPPVAHEGDLAAVHAQLLDQVPRRVVTTPDSPAIHAYSPSRSWPTVTAAPRRPRPRRSTSGSPTGPGSTSFGSSTGAAADTQVREHRLVQARAERCTVAGQPDTSTPRGAAGPARRPTRAPPGTPRRGRRRQVLEDAAHRRYGGLVGHQQQRLAPCPGSNSMPPYSSPRRGAIVISRSPTFAAPPRREPGPGRTVLEVQHEVDDEPGVRADAANVADGVGAHVPALGLRDAPARCPNHDSSAPANDGRLPASLGKTSLIRWS